MKIKYDNSERLEAVSDKQRRDALDELTAYIRWRLNGRTQRGAHSDENWACPPWITTRRKPEITVPLFGNDLPTCWGADGR